ncbi:transglutaminase superfamily protein [Pseudoduganella lurida]|uniref:Transglutaminase superfamily protein n=1 Tax=Pseudoduganella lurida TaxID=1036180 RepID=A0A562RKP7_9BURK|nr:DUF3857 and transglutaminase domain-containing protein [Pseudoduganella lurida]TWI69581.1 transglutaminase superfamily protein [Pseudoduganella lurida]
MMRRLLQLLVLLQLCAATLAAQAAGEGHVRALRERTEILIRADNTHEQIVDYTWRAIDAAGADTLGQQYVNWDSRRQTMELLAAETIPANGAPVPVEASGIKIQDGILGGVSFPEKRLLQITFPQLAAGDAIRVRYRLVQKVPELPGGMSHVLFLQDDVIRDDSTITVRYPQALPLKIAHNALASQPAVTENGERVLRWQFRSRDTGTPEANKANSWHHTPYLMLSTFASWQALADAYEQGAGPKSAVTPAIRTLADDIAGKAATPREQAHLLYDWVRANIRYVATYVGDGGWVPDDAAAILERRYGDCKDHVALLEALLAARGIEASPVLLLADQENYTLPSIPVMWFNHAISYLPALDLYLDSTDSTMPFGLLPDSDSGKPVLATRGHPVLRNTPLPDPDNHLVERRVTMRVALDGSAERVTEIIGHGRSAVAVQQFIDSVGPGGGADWVRRTMASNGYEGNGSLEILPRTKADTLAVRFTERIRNYVSQPEAGVLSFLPGVNGPVPLAGFAGRFTERDRQYDTRCEPFAVKDTMTIELPVAMQVLYVPKNLEINQEGLRYDARYTREETNSGMRYQLMRSARAGNPRGFCSPQEYAALRPAMNRISKAMHGRLVFVLNDTEMAAAAIKP